MFSLASTSLGKLGTNDGSGSVVADCGLSSLSFLLGCSRLQRIGACENSIEDLDETVEVVLQLEQMLDLDLSLNPISQIDRWRIHFMPHKNLTVRTCSSYYVTQ